MTLIMATFADLQFFYQHCYNIYFIVFILNLHEYNLLVLKLLFIKILQTKGHCLKDSFVHTLSILFFENKCTKAGTFIHFSDFSNK